MRLLSVGAHPDDIEFGCGGTLHGFARAGASIHLFVATRGELGGDPGKRLREQQRVAEALNATLAWGDFEDTKISLGRALIESIESQIRRVRPDIVFTHWRCDTHQDHRAIAEAVITASRSIANVLFFEGPTTHDFSPSVFMDISRDLPAKLRLLRLHKSQVNRTNVPSLSILELARSTAVFRGSQYRVKCAEGFMPQRLSLDGRFLRRPRR